MRRALVLLVGLAVGLGPLAAPAYAGDGRGHGHGGRPPVVVSGTISASGTWEYARETCGFVHEVFVGTFDTTGRRFDDGTFTLDLCIPGQVGEAWEVVGTFVVTLDSGATLSGSVSGTFAFPAGDRTLPTDLALVVTGSTGTRRPVTGTIAVTGDRTESVLFESSLAGTFTADLQL
ncbi:MAG: hypothetical protein PV358_01010 [Acidimicrobiales bacterium]|nr:hypothetical protein [Acidimicrobiales bacterium]